jgi:hypothetical protein
MKDVISQIEDLLETDFERDLLHASTTYISKVGDPLRFNSFSFSIRELFWIILARFSPDSNITKCPWFLSETPSGRPSRRQQVIYAVRGGLSANFLEDELNLFIDDEVKEIIDSINLLNNYTHVSHKTFNLEQEKCEEFAKNVLDSFINIFSLIRELNSQLKNLLHDYIGSEILYTFFENVFDDLDILSSQTIAESSYVEHFDIKGINHERISISGEGYVSVSLNYGPKNDSCEINDEFPFSFKCAPSVTSPTDLGINEHNIKVDTDSWYE